MLSFLLVFWTVLLRLKFSFKKVISTLSLTSASQAAPEIKNKNKQQTNVSFTSIFRTFFIRSRWKHGTNHFIISFRSIIVAVTVLLKCLREFCRVFYLKVRQWTSLRGKARIRTGGKEMAVLISSSRFESQPHTAEQSNENKITFAAKPHWYSCP